MSAIRPLSLAYARAHVLLVRIPGSRYYPPGRLRGSSAVAGNFRVAAACARGAVRAVHCKMFSMLGNRLIWGGAGSSGDAAAWAGGAHSNAELATPPRRPTAGPPGARGSASGGGVPSSGGSDQSSVLVDPCGMGDDEVARVRRATGGGGALRRCSSSSFDPAATRGWGRRRRGSYADV